MGGRFLDHWQPDAAAFVESELWPNLLAACQARGIPTDADQRAACRRGSYAALAAGPAALRARLIGAFDGCMRNPPTMPSGCAQLGRARADRRRAT